METQQLWISKCGKDEVFKLMKDTIEEASLETFRQNSKLFNRKWFCKMQPYFKQNMSFSQKNNAIENANLQENFNNFEEDLIEDFDKLKK